MNIRLNVFRSRFATVLVPTLFLISGCAVADKVGLPSKPLLEPIYDGVWIARVENYRRSQTGPAKPGYSQTNWTCGNGKPFQVKIKVQEGVVVTAPSRNSIEAGRVSVNATFKTSYSRKKDRTAVMSGNFKKRTGTLQYRKDSLNGCYYKFKLTKQG